ncbi:ankyrin repeat-containing domain protein [Mycena pura]|uniref:Ankyrin repeat-containing domain protein n=1 Tax=Mycena pura TaxID=153505 RepID=A0AAD6VKB2_9AGAR|nr:ankyrin repeat-containing domain protein [Mycena pura]
MTSPKSVPPPTSATQSKTDKFVDAATTLKVGIEILGLLSGVTKNVPYLGVIAGCIEKLIKVRESMKTNKARAGALLDNIWEVSRVLVAGLQNMDPQSQSTAANNLKNDLERYQIVLTETCGILDEWTSKGLVKRVWSHGDFPDIADGIDRRINMFRDTFSASRLIDLSQGQDVMHAKLQVLVDEKTRAKLDQWIRPSVHVADSQRNAANKRHPKTGLWFLECPEFREWIYAPSSFLWLHGISGSGKTVLSSAIIDAIHARAEHYVFFYFDTNNPEQQTVTHLLCSLVTQLSIRSNPPDGKLGAMWTSHANGQKLLTDVELISDALLPLLKDFDQKPVYMVLDALDECSDRPGLLRLISTVLDAKLLNVHILVTSRPEVQAGRPELVKLAVSVSLEKCVDGDIELYLTEVLSNESGWIYEKRDQIKSGLLEHSNGMFRLVALQLDEVRKCDGRRSQLEKVLKNMPDSLNTIYDRILQKITNPDMRSTVCRTMNWLIFSKRAMTLQEIVDALAFDFEHTPLRFDTEERMGPDALLAACAGFVVVSEDGIYHTFKLAHSSVKEYFLGSIGPRLSGDCEISEQAAHHLLARTCISYLCSFDRVLKSHADLQQYPLTLYATGNWMLHLTLCDDIGLDKCGNTENWHKQGLKQVMIPSSREGQNMDVPSGPNHARELIDAVMQLIQPESTQYSTLLHLYDVDNLCLKFFASAEPTPSLPSLYMAASLGIGQVVWKLLEQAADSNAHGQLNAQSGKYGTALQVASYRGYIKIVHILLESGVDVNVLGGEYGSALQAASYEGQIEIVRLLLKSDVDVNVQGGTDGNALQAALCGGHIEIAHLLLESGADVNAQGGHHGNALQAASYGGHIEIVRLLLESGVDVNMRGGRGSNALQAASYRGHIEIVHILLASGIDMNAQGGEYGTALQAALSGEHIEIVRLLLESGVVVSAKGAEYSNALQAASYRGHIEIVHLLLMSGVDVNAQGGEYGTALQAASYGGHIEIVRLLLKSGIDVNVLGGEYGTALQAASYGGHIEIVPLLLKSGIDVNTLGGEYGTALQAASYGGHIEIARQLIKNAADVNAQGGEYGNALQAASYRGHIEIARLLIKNAADVNAQGGKYGNALQAASYRGHIEIVHLLLMSGVDVNAQGGEYGTALQAASYGGHIEIVRLLLKSGIDVNVLGGEYGTALQAASYGGHIEIVRLLLKSDVDVNVQGGMDGNALQAALCGGHIEIAHLLLESGANVNAQGGHHGNALQAALYGGHIEIARLLINNAANVNAQGGKYGNALQATSYRGHIEIVHLLLMSGVDVNAQGGEYGTALQAASYGGHIKIVRLLLKSGIDVNTLGGEYGTALQAASYGGHIEIARLLIKNAADVNAQGGKYGNALQAASYRGHIEIVHLLLMSGVDVNAQGGEYGTALQAASYGGHIEIVRLLLKSGIDVNVLGGEYGTALQAASYGGHIEIACLLIKNAADVNAQGGKYGNALQAASYRGHIKIVHLLLESGVDVNVQGGEYGNALQAASRGEHTEIAHLLREMGECVRPG